MALGPINTKVFDEVLQAIEDLDAAEAEACAELQKLMAKTMGSISAELTAAEKQLAFLAPFVELASLSLTNLPQVITFLTKFVEAAIGPQAAAFPKYVAQVAALVAKGAEIVAAAESKASHLPTCGLTIPTLPTVTIPSV